MHTRSTKRAPVVPAPLAGSAAQRKLAGRRATPEVPAPAGGNVGAAVQRKPARSPATPAVPAPAGGNVGATAQRKAAGAPGRPVVPAPAGGNVGATAQRKAAGAPGRPVVPAPAGGNVGATAQRKAAGAPGRPAVPAPAGGNVGATAQRKAAGAPGRPVVPAPAGGNVAQAKLVTKNGEAMSEAELNNLAESYPELLEQIIQHHQSSTEYTAIRLRGGIRFEEYRPPSKSWHWTKPKDYEGDLSEQTMYEVAKKYDVGMKVERTDMDKHFTQQQLDFGKMMSFSFEGSKKLEQGSGLKESGLSRNHHLADSSIRAIVEYLYKNRGWANGSGWKRVHEWMKALTHGQGLADDLFKMLVNAQSINDLDAIVDALSNNPWNVGIGDAQRNTDIGPNFDESVTKSGFVTTQGAMISMFTEFLKGLVPDDMIRAALNRLQHKQTGQKLRSMQMNLDEPVVLGPGTYDAANLTDREIVALFDTMLSRNNVPAQSIAMNLKGDRAAIVDYCRRNNLRFRIDSMGSVWIALRGG